MKVLKELLSFLGIVVLALVLSFLLRTFVFGTYKIPSGSMEDTIQVGDLLIGERLSLYVSAPKPGDIVTFQSPVEEEVTLIKRVIAVGGQTVNLVDGVVYVNGAPLDESSYVHGESWPLSTAADVELSYPYEIPEGYIWVMGDNRENSADSRYFGPVRLDTVSSVAVFIYWPLNHLGVLH